MLEKEKRIDSKEYKISAFLNTLSKNSSKFVSKKRVPLYLALFLIASLVYSPAASFGMHKSEKITWQLIFISPYGGCTNYQYQMADKYDEVTTKYFELYQFPNTKYQPQCMSDAKYSKYHALDDIDLLILVYDREIGKKELNNNDLGGAYIHVGADKTKNHTIVLCDCPNFKFSDPVWILSHEMSHFILYYLNYDKTIVEDKIHSMDEKYDQCVEVHYDNSCSNVRVQLRGSYYFSYVTVMAPYAPAIGQSATLVKEVKVEVSPHIVDIQREVTKWWMAGQINDTEYAKVLSYSVDEQTGVVKPDNYSSYDKAIVFPDGPDGKKINETYYDIEKEWSKDKISTIFSRVPVKYEVSNQLGNTLFPDWFKSRAHWWAEGKFWDDSEFLSAAKHIFGDSGVK